jgi:hypothetical protein
MRWTIILCLALAACGGSNESLADKADQAWSEMGVTSRAAFCDVYRQMGESVIVSEMMSGAELSEDEAGAMLVVVKREC